MPNRLVVPLVYAAFVVYGSLVPLEFRPLSWERAFSGFAAIPFLDLAAEQRADWIANGVLYLPLGLLIAHGLCRALGAAAGGVLAWLACATLAVAVEFVQQFFPARTVSQNDILAEWTGSAVGVLLAPRLDGWIGRMRQAWASRGAALPMLLLQGYTVLYLLLNFFPYDLLLSAAELQVKLNSELWAWWTAPSERGLALVLVQLGVEALLCAPLGALLALGRRRGLALLAALALGLLIGLLLELGQFFIVSGVSQGASVVARALGIAAGAWLAPRVGHLSPDLVRTRVRRLFPLILLVWLPPLLLANGWFRTPWQGAAAAATTWDQLRLMPFYYHYYTSEAIALFSLGSVALMYSPLALLAWARGWSQAGLLMLVAVVVLPVELSKLFLSGKHPDPTNLLIAPAAAALAWWALGQWGRVRPAPAVQQAVQPVTAASGRGAAITSALALACGLALAMTHPVARVPLCAGLVMAAAVVWRWPVAALALILAGLPVLDLAPWSGRTFVDEWDLLVLVCLGVAWARTSAPARTPWRGGRTAAVLVGLALSFAMLRGMVPLQAFDFASLNHPVGPQAAVRIFKGAMWAACLLALWSRLEGEGPRRAQMLTLGMIAGLVATVIWVAWERWAFGALGDIGRELRITGPFSSMSKGGAYIECYLVVATAFLLGQLLRRGLRWGWRAAGMALLAASVAALMITFSRNGYAALLVVLLVLGLAAWRVRSPAAKRWAGATLALVALVAVPVALSPYASSRLADSGADLAVRHAHWQDAVSIRSPGGLPALLGEGLGRFPELHFWRSREAQRAASYRVLRDADTHFLRLGAGATLYIEQVIPHPSARTVTVEARLRSPSTKPALQVAICEKWTLTSHHCQSLTLQAATAAGAWQVVAAVVTLPANSSALPLKFSLLTPGAGEAIDVTGLRLLTDQGQQLLANGDFSDGLDRWFFATDVDPPWHIHNLPLALWFDQGWFGVLAWGVFVAWALWAGARAAGSAGPTAWIPVAAAAGFLTSGLLNTLIDEPRFLMLFLLLLGLAGRGAFAPGRPGP